MAQDNRLMPVSGLDRSIDRPLADFVTAKPYGVAGEPTTLREYLFVVLKRKWLILSLVLVVTSLVTIQSFRAPSIYEGETTIRIEQRPMSVLQTKEIVITGQNDPNFWGTQLKLLENPALARQVVLNSGSATQSGVLWWANSGRRVFLVAENFFQSQRMRLSAGRSRRTYGSRRKRGYGRFANA